MFLVLFAACCLALLLQLLADGSLRVLLLALGAGAALAVVAVAAAATAAAAPFVCVVALVVGTAGVVLLLACS